MAAIVKTFLVLALTVMVMPLLAQTPKTPNTKAPVQKSKLPKLTTVLGARSDSVSITIEEALQLIKFPLRITDDKKTAYQVYTYQFLYRRKEITEDENTGKVSPATSMIANRFSSTPLPDIWQMNIGVRLRSGEELFFFDIVVKDATGKLMFAPSLKIIIL